MNDHDAAMLLWNADEDQKMYGKYMADYGMEMLCDLNASDRLLFWMLVYKAEGKRLP